MREFNPSNPLNILLVVTPEVGTPDNYEKVIMERFPELVANGTIRIRKFTDGADTDEVLDTHIVGTGSIPQRIPEMKDLQFVMTFSSGTDHWKNWGKLPKHVPLTHFPGGSGIPISEFVLGQMLNLAKKYIPLWENQKERKYIRIFGEELYGKTLGIIGLGGIGRQIAKRAKAFDMHVIGADIFTADLPNVDAMFLFDRVDDVIKQSDFLVISCPETEETRGMMNEDRFKMMKKTAYFINCARGSLVIKEAFMKALNEGWIAGAAQDTWWVKTPVPSYLPADDEVWGTKNLLISPHISSFSEMYERRFGEVFVENIDRFLKGDPLTFVAPGFEANRE